MNFINSLNKSREWIENNSDNYVVISSKKRKPYCEVTGYYIPTLKKFGFRDKAKSFADYLSSVQHRDGYWGLNGNPYIFDTTQILEGLFEFKDDYKKEIDKALNWVDSQIKDDRFLDPFKEKMKMSDHLYPRAIWCLNKVGYDTNRLERSYCIEKNQLFTCLSHFYAYSFEGHARLKLNCDTFLNELKKYDYLLPEVPSSKTYCYTGLSQVALSLFLLGMQKEGRKVLEFVSRSQSSSGGFVGSNGSYFPNEEISWAVKFYLDAFWQYNLLSFEKQIGSFKSDFEGGKNDKRLNFVLKNIDYKDTVLDAGCGKGRYINNISCTGKFACDISDASKYVKAKFSVGSCLDLPYHDNKFDKIICSEALEHCVFHDNAINEMIRVLKPGGKVLIIDKQGDIDSNKLHFGEKWPDMNGISKRYGGAVERIEMPYVKMPFYGMVISK